MTKRAVFFCLLLLPLALAAGCRKPHARGENLPLPPVGDSGIANGWYVQAEYGFALPLPKGFAGYAPNPDDQGSEDFDEWIRLMDSKKEAIFRILTEDRDSDKRFTVDDLKKEMGDVFTAGEYQVTGVGKTLEWAAGSDRWIVVPYDLKDRVKKEWRTWVCALAKDDYVLWVRATLPRASAQKAAGDRLTAALQPFLTQVKWYQPVGPRGISLEHYELQKFDADFTAALESGNVTRTLGFFDDTSPARLQWVDRYKQLLAPVEGKGNSGDAALKARDAGLVINGKLAAAYFTFQRGNAPPTRLGFRLSKEDRAWSIVSIERMDKH